MTLTKDSFSLLYPGEKRKRKKKIRAMTLIPVVLIVFALLIQCFTMEAYASVYCKYCGSAYAWSNDLTCLYHVQLYDGGCPAATLYEEEESGQLTVSLSNLTYAMREAYYNANDDSVLLELYDGFTLTRPSSYSSSDFNGTYDDDTVSASDENLGNYNSNAVTITAVEEDDYIIIAGDMIDTVFGTAAADETGGLMDPMTILDESCSYVIKAMNTITGLSLYRALQAIGMSLMVIYFLMEFATMEHHRYFGKPMVRAFAQPLGRLLISLVLLYNSWEILRFFLYLAQYCFYQIESLGEINAFLSSEVENIQTMIGEAAGYDFEVRAYTSFLSDITGKWEQTLWNAIIGLGLAVTFFVPWLLTQAADIAAVWVIFSRTVNLVVMGVLAPIAMSDLYSDTSVLNTRAFDYIRKYAGVAFQCVTIPLVFYAANIVSQGYLTSLLNLSTSDVQVSTFAAIALYISMLKVVQIGAVINSGRTAKEIFGVS